MQKHWKESIDLADKIARGSGCTLTHKVSSKNHLLLEVQRPDGSTGRVAVSSSPRTDYHLQYVRQQLGRVIRGQL